MSKPLKFAAVGIDHRHIFGQIQHMLGVGGEFLGWWTNGEPNTLASFLKRFGDSKRYQNLEEILDDDRIDLILLAAIPCDRADLAIQSMRAGKDVMVDKPGCTTLAQLDRIRDCVRQTGRIWTIDFSERFEVACVTRAAELVQQGAIGSVVQTLGMGPHRLNRATRPAWFFNRASYGGILCDIGSHQIDQFLYFTRSTDAQVRLATVANYANPENPGLQDFGEIVLQSERGHGYIRLDWYTPDALPTWGDGRLTILGTEGYIELRKYVDVARDTTSDHLFLVNASRHEKIDCSNAGFPYFAALRHDIAERSETAMAQTHAFKVTELALKAQQLAEQQHPAGPWADSC